MTVNYYKSEMIAIPPWPKSKPNKLPFESCAKPTDKSKDHLITSRNSAMWYAHTIEEIVIWTVEREYGKHRLNTTHQAHTCTNVTCDYCLTKFIAQNYEHTDATQSQLKNALNVYIQ